MKVAKFIALVIVFVCSIARADIIEVPDFRADQDPIPNSLAGVASSLTYNYSVIFYRTPLPSPAEGDLFARRFDLDGNPLGNAFRVDSAPVSAGSDGSGVIIDSNGNMVFCFADTRSGQIRIYFNRFDLNENQITVDTEVVSAIGGRIASLPSGGFVIVYDRGDIYARIYDSTGSPIGGEFQVNQSGSDIDFPQVATSTTGQIYIAWTFGSPGTAVYARLFDSSGNPLDNEFRVDQSTEGVYSRTIAAAPNGNFIVGWKDKREGGSFGPDVAYGRVFDSSGNPITDDLKLLQNTPVGQPTGTPSATSDPSGRFIIVCSDSQVVEGAGIYMRRIDSFGQFMGVESRIDSGNSNGTPYAAPVGSMRIFTAWPDQRVVSGEIWANIVGPEPSIVPFASNTVLVILALLLLATLIFSLKRRNMAGSER